MKDVISLSSHCKTYGSNHELTPNGGEGLSERLLVKNNVVLPLSCNVPQSMKGVRSNRMFDICPQAIRCGALYGYLYMQKRHRMS